MTQLSLRSIIRARPMGYWVALAALVAMTLAFIAWTGVGWLTAVVLLGVFAFLVLRPPQNMAERWSISAPLWVLALGVVVAAIVFLRPDYMPSVQTYLMDVGLRLAVDQTRRPDDFEALRRAATVSVNRKPRLLEGLERQVIDTPEVKGEWLRPVEYGSQTSVILWMHGGSYVSGHPATTRPIAMSLVHRTGVPVLSLNYRLAPENPYPAALNDVTAAYDWLLQSGFRPGFIFVGGESSGAGLAVALALKLKQTGQPQPAGLIAVSPWVDLTGSAESMNTRAARDAMLNPNFLRAAAKAYGGDDLRNPFISPLFGDLSGLSPLIIQDGDDSILVDDAVRLADAVKAARGDVSLRIWPGSPHIVTSLFMFLPEGRRSLDEIEAFIRVRLDRL